MKQVVEDARMNTCGLSDTQVQGCGQWDWEGDWVRKLISGVNEEMRRVHKLIIG